MELYSSYDPSRLITFHELRECCRQLEVDNALEMTYLGEEDAAAYLIGILKEHKIDRHAFMKACGIELRL